MKKVLLAVFVLALFVPVVKADEVEAYFKWGKLEMTVPIKDNVKIVSLYDLWQGEGLIGGETQIAGYESLSLNFGAVSSFLGKGTPYMSVDRLVSKTGYRMGLWVGRDFNLGVYRAGIKASVPLW